MHRAASYGCNRHCATGNRQCSAVHPAGRYPAAVDLKTEAALRLKHPAMGLPFRGHVVVMEAVYDRGEEFVESLRRDVHQVTLSLVRRGRPRMTRTGHQAAEPAVSRDLPYSSASTGVPSSTVRVTVHSR